MNLLEYELLTYNSKLLELNSAVNTRLFTRLQSRKNTDRSTISIYISLRLQKERVMIATGIKCKVKEFNAKKQKMADANLNLLCRYKLSEVYRAYNILLLSNREFTLKDLAAQISPKRTHITFKTIANDYFEAKAAKVRESTLKAEKSILFSLLKRMKMENKAVESVKVMEMEERIRAACAGYAKCTIHNALNYLNGILTRAERLGSIDRNILLKIDLSDFWKDGKIKEREIPNIDTIIEKANTVQTLLDDAAAFQSLTAVSFADMKAMASESFVTVGNASYISATRQKTGVPFLIPISSTVKHLFDRNQGFHLLDYFVYNKHLKANYSISSHALRHAKARQLLNKGLSLEAVARVLGHASTQMTIRYAPIHHRGFTDKELVMFGE
jgi:integrase